MSFHPPRGLILTDVALEKDCKIIIPGFHPPRGLILTKVR